MGISVGTSSKAPPPDGSSKTVLLPPFLSYKALPHYTPCIYIATKFDPYTVSCLFCFARLGAYMPNEKASFSTLK